MYRAFSHRVANLASSGKWLQAIGPLPVRQPANTRYTSLQQATRLLFRSPSAISHRQYATHREVWQSFRNSGSSRGPTFWQKWKIPLLFTAGVLLVDHYVVPPVVNSIPALRRNPDAVVYGLIGLNLVGWFLWRTPRAYLMMRYGLLEKTPARFNPWQMLGSAFSHQDGMHIFFNMFVLYQFGIPVAHWIGSGNLLCAYLDGCVLSSLGSMLLPILLRTGGPILPSLGASGAVFAIMGIFSYLAPNARLALWFIPLPFGAWWVFLGTFAWNAWSMVAPARFVLGRSLDYAGHVAGSLSGMFYAWWICNQKKSRRRRNTSIFGF